LPNIGNFQTGDQLTANPIIIVDDNLAQELLYEQFITDIAVDGANNKWIGTADSGLFCLTKWAGNQVSFYDKYLPCLVMLLMILI
jgi:hypothetical protein